MRGLGLIRSFACLEAIALLTFASFPLQAQADIHAAEEYQLKAAFLYSFAKFVTWPNDESHSAPGPLVLGIVGADPFGPILDQVVAGKTVRGRNLIIKRFPRPEDLQLCDIVFVGVSDKNQLQRILRTLSGTPVLTVGDTEGFTQLGGVIGMVLSNRKVGIEINRKAADRQGLKISSHLLRLARLTG